MSAAELIGDAVELLADLWDWWPEGKAKADDKPQPVPTPEYHERPSGRAD